MEIRNTYLVRIWYVFASLNAYCVYSLRISGFSRPPLSGGLDLDSRSSGCARLGGGVGPPLGVVVEEVAVLVVLVRRHCHAVRAAVRRAVDDEISSAIKEETGPAAVRRVSPCLLNARPVHALGAPGIIVVVRYVRFRFSSWAFILLNSSISSGGK